MSFNKRYISKNIILNQVSIEHVVKLFESDMIVLDQWSSNFYGHLDPKIDKWRSLREKEIQKNIFDSNVQKPQTLNTFYLSNIFFDLRTNPNWIDIVMTLSQLCVESPQDISGDFDKMTSFCLEQITKYYEPK